jgi:alpha-1,3-rhamnosyltransferase
MKDNYSPLVSVIIPAYNHERYIQETILSIINQTYKNIELCIIDDGSNDLTYDKICEMEIKCKKRFVRFDFSKQENRGIIEAVNSLINMTRGEYVYIIASDDVAAPHAIETELDFLANHSDYALCVGNNDIIDENSRRCFWDKYKNNVYDVEEAHYISFSDCLIKNYPEINFFSEDFGSYYNLIQYSNHIPNGYLIRKAIFEKTGLYTTEAPVEDYWMMIQIAKHSKKKYLCDTLFYYRWHGKNTVRNQVMGEFIYKTLFYEFQRLTGIEEVYDQNEGLEARMKHLKNSFYSELLKMKNSCPSKN